LIAVIGLGVVALLGGGVIFAWNAGLFAGADAQTAGVDPAATETGVVAVAEAGSEADTAPTDSTETGTELGTETSGEIAAAGETDGETPTDTGPSTPTDADDGGDDNAGGGASGGNEGQPKPIEYGNLIRQGTLYTHKSRGPNGDWDASEAYCRSLKRKKRHGLTKWRLATVAELNSFAGTEVDRLRYWTSEKNGSKARAVTIMTGQVSERDVTDPTLRAFCVSRK
jgi:hypothetical protein